jgi:hypothetical protein
VGNAPARGPRRRRDQDRGPGGAGRRGAVRASIPGGRELALLRDLQPEQAKRLAGPPPPPGSRRPRGPRAGRRRRLFEPARRPAGEAAPHVRRPEGRQSAHRLLLPLGVRHDRPAGRRRRLRLHDAGPRRLDGPDRRAGRAADEERVVARRSVRRVCLHDCGARRLAAGAARRRRLRLRHLAVRDCAARAGVRRDVGGEQGI